MPSPLPQPTTGKPRSFSRRKFPSFGGKGGMFQCGYRHLPGLCWWWKGGRQDRSSNIGTEKFSSSSSFPSANVYLQKPKPFRLGSQIEVFSSSFRPKFLSRRSSSDAKYSNLEEEEFPKEKREKPNAFSFFFFLSSPVK